MDPDDFTHITGLGKTFSSNVSIIKQNISLRLHCTYIMIIKNSCICTRQKFPRILQGLENGILNTLV